MRDVVQLGDVECVDVRSQADASQPRVARLLAANHTDHAGFGETTMRLDPPRLQLRGNELGGKRFFKRRLRVSVQFAPPCGHFGMPLGQSRVDVHVGSCLS